MNKNEEDVLRNSLIDIRNQLEDAANLIKKLEKEENELKDEKLKLEG